MAANLKARIAALKTTAAAGASGVATIARTNAWREWASAQNMDIVSFCEFALTQLTDDNDAQQATEVSASRFAYQRKSVLLY